jgi:hypothetical protein
LAAICREKLRQAGSVTEQANGLFRQNLSFKTGSDIFLSISKAL